ncbi:protein FAM180A isoform X2 [Hippocampus comes]|uniref:protein FAM180A isoform X2 n=1 Tax=Hippocampus comes TaxID=109280 RepID=UPI00094E3E8C|nr:PREDICTED: protein FAM180A-like isoform X2 [Hippocampus comes]
MKMKLQLRIWQLVIMWMCFKQALQGKSPTRSTVVDPNLMFEFLLGGVELNQDSNIVLLDEEMASMRPGRAFLSRVNNNIPRSLSSMQQMVDVLKSRRKEPMTQDLFESLVLSMVRSAYQTGNQRRPKDREAWGEMLLQLANLTVHELRGSYLLSYM